MLVGRTTKDSATIRRVTVDFITNGWLDFDETIVSVTTPTVVVEQLAVFAPAGAPPALPADTTPMTVGSVAIVSNSQKVQLMLNNGTPGLTYKVTFVATGGTSARAEQIDFFVFVRPIL